MAALGKALTVSALAFGTFAWGGGHGDWQKPYNNSYHKDSKAKHASYDNDHDRKDRNDRKDGKHRNFYQLSWDDRKRLCDNDNYWNEWQWYYGDKDDYCKDFRDRKDHNKDRDYGKHDDRHDGKYARHDNRDYGNKHDDKKYARHADYNKRDDHKKYNDGRNYGGHNDYGRKHDDRKFVQAYNKDERFNASFSEKHRDHEKKAYVVEASSHDKDRYNDYSKRDDGHKDYGRKDHGKNYGHDNNYGSYGYHENNEDFKAASFHEKDRQSSVKADVDQRTVVNNYVAVYGDNNVVHNNVSVANTASVEQKVSSNEVNAKVVEYSNSSDKGYGNYGHDSYGKGGYDSYGNDGYHSNDTSFKAAEYSEKSSSSEVKQSASYQLDESFTQVKDDDHDYGHGDRKDRDYDKDYDHDGYRQDW